MTVADKHPQTYESKCAPIFCTRCLQLKAITNLRTSISGTSIFRSLTTIILEQTIRSIFDNERNKQESALQDADQLRRH